jgi:ceramide glucosyltransferase
MKPCAGADDDLEQCLETFCTLRYPRYQLVCGVRDANDAAYPILKRVMEKHPEVDMTVVLTGPGAHPSPKVSNLDPMSGHAKYKLYWLSDSNTRVHPDTLTGMVDDLVNQPNVGAVVSPVIGDDERSTGAAIENLHMTAYVGMTTFTSWGVPRMMTAPGKSALIHHDTIMRFGGWDELGRYFGEDLILYNRVREHGQRVVLGRHIVTNVSATGPIQRFLTRHMRWMQIRWTAAPMAANLFEPFLTAIVMPTLFVLVMPSLLSLSMLLAAATLQIACDQFLLWRFRKRTLALRFVPLILLRPYLVFFLWIASLFNKRVVWRGSPFWMGAQSRILTEPPVTALRSVRNALR